MFKRLNKKRSDFSEFEEESELEIVTMADSSSNNVPILSNAERKEVARRTTISAIVIHESIREAGERELRRRSLSLAWSALAAGLTMGFSLVVPGLLYAYLPDATWRPLVDNLGYSVGFLIVILGRQQLFTENTLTVILPLLAHPNKATFLRVLRLWGIVLGANMVGAFLFATIIAHSDVFPPAIQSAFAVIAEHSLRGDFWLTVVRGIFAGWLIALMVWVLPTVQSNKPHIIILITYIVSLGGFAHIIAGSIDVLYLVNIGAVSWGTFFFSFMIPTLFGNIIGGVSLVAALNYAQVATEEQRGVNGQSMQKASNQQPTFLGEEEENRE
ncbi:MAG TPA: formate/nitrite transporter family protein [Ktedonobacteraceae bacterium]